MLKTAQLFSRKLEKGGRWKIRTTKFPGSGKMHFRKFFPGLTGPNSSPPPQKKVTSKKAKTTNKNYKILQQTNCLRNVAIKYHLSNVHVVVYRFRQKKGIRHSEVNATKHTTIQITTEMCSFKFNDTKLTTIVAFMTLELQCQI